jgi:hypothetical protein
VVRPRHNDVQLNVRCSSSPSLGVGFGAGFRQGLPFTSAWCGSRLTKSAQCSGYCAVLVVEMLGLTAYRRNPKRCCWLALNRPGQSQRAPTRTAQFGCRMVADFAERRLGRDPRLQIRDGGEVRQLILVRRGLHDEFCRFWRFRQHFAGLATWATVTPLLVIASRQRLYSPPRPRQRHSATTPSPARSS